MVYWLSSSSDSSWRIFIYKELHIATNGFSDEKKLGEGGFGSVYFGKTYDGLQIEVKKLKSMNSKAEVEFAVEVEVLGRVRHKNLLGLRGYCADAGHRLIVYDYMPNLSLLSHLHGQYATDVKLDWKRRMRIAIGSAEGLSNGWFETQMKICLSISNHHPEHWQPSWSVQTALVALITFMPTIPNGALGSLDYKKEQRCVPAVKSRSWGCSNTDVKVIIGPSGRQVQGKREWTVIIFNSCNCPVGGMSLSCPDFNTVEPIPSSMFLRSADGCCLINQGRALLPKTSVRFSYAWDTKFALLVRDSNPEF
ncbi:hypothetical protein POM88_030108 [Heracleum sosnowskyi]|uniref:Protein kinase domain-containing protein n=1 Tax=Heracleum sosnowskyi TaxID=360622 RepID=A0AAD8HXY5_9APIA|nr:hypothetical protein POM88_030108 [Heracleum sosnowskyi]